MINHSISIQILNLNYGGYSNGSYSKKLKFKIRNLKNCLDLVTHDLLYIIYLTKAEINYIL